MDKRKENKEPWLKHLKYAKNRCSNVPKYSEKNIKCFLTKDDIKSIWFRDKALT